jgi:hypothetical protein
MNRAVSLAPNPWRPVDVPHNLERDESLPTDDAHPALK